jgi:hypothetical protein
MRRRRPRTRSRLIQLREELEEARQFGYQERAERGEEEIGDLMRERKNAVALGGRDRRIASASERARVAVTRSIHHRIPQSVS